MFHSITTFRGHAATPGIFLTITRVNRGHECFFSFMQTGNRKAGRAYSPLCSISYQLTSDTRDYPVRDQIVVNGWKVEDCAFRMWLLGRIDQHPACAGLPFNDCCLIALILAAMIRKHLTDHGREAVGFEDAASLIPKNKSLTEIALILFKEFLDRIAPHLLEDFDLDLPNLELDKMKVM